MAKQHRVRRRARRSRARVRRAPASSAANVRMDAKQSLSGQGGLMIGGVLDPAERAADRMADRVMRMPASQPLVQRKCEACEGGEKKVQRVPEEPEKEDTVQAKVQAKASAKSAPVASGAGASAASPGAAKAIRSLGTGQPLARAERAFFEPRMGADLSSVRVHDGRAADKANRAINSRAFTLGNDIAFAKGERQPGTETGRHLMAHELAHVREQGRHGMPSLQRQAKPIKKKACDRYKKQKQNAFGTLYPKVSRWGVGILKQRNATKFVAALPEKEGGVTIFKDSNTKGSKAKYALILNKINQRRGFLRGGQCMAYPIGWVDPNIGNIADEVKVLNRAGAKARKIDVIATIYAEQSLFFKDAKINELLDKQRDYIYYSMLLRVGSSEFSAKLKDIVTGGAYHGKKVTTKKGTYTRNYLPAKEYLEKGSTKKKINVATVKKIRDLVGDKALKPPANAGRYYFHWSKDTKTAEKEYQKVKKEELKKGKKEAAASAKAEKAGAILQAKLIGASEPGAWLKKIAGPNKGKTNERMGSMYIYK